MKIIAKFVNQTVPKVQQKMIKILLYIKKNYKWIVGLLFSAVLALLSLSLPNILNPSTKQLYFLPAFERKSSKNLTTVTCWPSLESTRFEAVSCSLNGSPDNASRIDPCFERYDFKTVECPTTPYSTPRLYTKISNTIRSETPKRSNAALPWFIRLNDGMNCNYFTGGASAFLDGRIDYICDDANRTYLSAPIQKDGNHWTIRCTNASKTRVEYCPIREAWF